MDEHDVIRFMGRFPDSITHKCETCLCTEGGHICNYSKPDYSCYIPNSETQIASLEIALAESQEREMRYRQALLNIGAHADMAVMYGTPAVMRDVLENIEEWTTKALHLEEDGK